MASVSGDDRELTAEITRRDMRRMLRQYLASPPEAATAVERDARELVRSCHDAGEYELGLAVRLLMALRRSRRSGEGLRALLASGPAIDGWVRGGAR